MAPATTRPRSPFNKGPGLSARPRIGLFLLLLHCRQNRFLIFQNGAQRALVLLDRNLVRKNCLLIGLDGGLVGENRLLVPGDGGLVGEDGLLVGNHLGFRRATFSSRK